MANGKRLDVRRKLRHFTHTRVVIVKAILYLQCISSFWYTYFSIYATQVKNVIFVITDKTVTMYLRIRIVNR